MVALKQDGKRILMVQDSSYPADIRPRKEAAALRDAGYQVTVISRRRKNQKWFEMVDGVAVYRIPDLELFSKGAISKQNFFGKNLRRAKSVLGYAMEFNYFTFVTMVMSLVLMARRGIDVLHAHNPPDTVALSGAIYRLLGKQYVFDHHDLSPELYLSRVSVRKGLIYRTLVFFEGLSCKLSNVVICTNESYKQIETRRHGINPEKIFIVRNNPSVSECSIERAPTSSSNPASEKKKLLFLGSINPQDGLEALLHALQHLVFGLGYKNFSCDVVGGGDSLEAAKILADELSLTGIVNFTGQIYDRRKVLDYLSAADICLEPAPENALNKFSTFIKVMEYMAAGKPVVAFDLIETRYSASDAAQYVPAGDIIGYAEAIKLLMDDPNLAQALGARGQKRIREDLNWDMASAVLLRAYRSLGEAL